MKVGICGFAKVGKTTLFNTLTGANIATNAYAQEKNEMHLGVAHVPDDRLTLLSTMFKPKKTTAAKIEYVDVVGVQKGEAAGNDHFLTELKNVDLLLHVVRSFEDDNIVHSQGNIDPKRDISALETELILADLMVVTTRLERLEKNIQKANRDQDKAELDTLKLCAAHLEAEKPLRELVLPPEEQAKLRGYTLLSAKPMLVVVNMSEKELLKVNEASPDQWLCNKKHVLLVTVSAKVEMEIANLDVEDRIAFLEDLHLDGTCLDRVIQASYQLLGCVSFFTVGEDECRAWTIRQGDNAQKAAGAIHSDLERGFIRAEVIGFEQLREAGSWNSAKTKGWLRLEGKQYIVQDGDILHIRFNV